MTLSFQGDAGNKATVAFLSECAMALAVEKGELPNCTGFLTPVIAFGETLQQRLTQAGCTVCVADI